MFKVCDAMLAVISTHQMLHSAKQEAKTLAERTSGIYLVCDHTGMIVASWGRSPIDTTTPAT